ncbi:MAG: hypothetical protein NTW87_03990 [Planctomycetota bacterium]|nr:hypothetical protein [Planctomycetota bacterium]
MRARDTAVALLGLLLMNSWLKAATIEVPLAEWEKMKADIEALRKKDAAANAIEKSPVDKTLAKYGPNAAVTTKAGRLTLSGFVQIWYYTIQNDHRGLFDDRTVNDITDINSTSDNDSLRIRRTELRFTMDLNEHLTTVVMLDPAREATSFPAFPTNQGIFKRAANSRTGSAVTNVQTGAGGVPRFLQDAYIVYKGIVPHHEFQIGQFKPPSFAESARTSNQLDFVERSFLGQLGDNRDLGGTVRGSWHEERIQYWLGAFDGAGNLLQSAGQAQNRSDDNDAKDYVFRALFRPVWKHSTWGNLELGGAALLGEHGESGSPDPIADPTNGLNRQTTAARRFNAWADYQPGGPAKGLWLRGEWGSITDRNAPSSVVDLLGNDLDAKGTQDYAKATTVQGWYASAGYKVGDSPYAATLPTWFQPFEFALRYEALQNTQVADLVKPDHTDNFKTQVYTGGINYYMSGHNAKIQLNYNHVLNPDGGNNPNRNFHDVRNDSLVVNFQVGF